ncbi:MAG: M61 family metallopeptidase [Phycisphaeraceae bacterium]|nr:M61 family metallopeptidase [Phycisphaeraceae bacterium]
MRPGPTMMMAVLLHTGLWLAGCATAQPIGGGDAGAWAERVRTEYVVSLAQAHAQTVEITLILDDVDAPSIDLHLPVWRPGRYAINDHAGTVRRVRAEDGRHRPLDIEKTAKSTWRVRTAGAETVRVHYDLYANSIADRTRHADDTHAFLSGSSVFMYADERRAEPVRVTIDAPDGWRVATGLDPDPHLDRSWIARDYDVLVDSPIEVGLHHLIEFDVDGVPHEIVIWGRCDPATDKLRDDFAKIVATQRDIFGDLPYGRYVFLIHAYPGGSGGTEHLNSTIMQTTPAAVEGGDAYRRLLGLTSHEFFHTWNVKRLRPAGLVPYDYLRENYTDLLWVAEGTTVYYTDLTLVRAGLVKPDDYLRDMAGRVASERARPGIGVQSLAESSFDAWIKFNRSTPDSVNATVSFYSKGSLVSMMLDMEVRRLTNNAAALDDVMADLYRRHTVESGGFTTADLLASLERHTGTSFEEFFERYVSGVEPLELESAYAVAGLTLEPRKPRDDDPKSYLGLDLRQEGDFAVVAAARADGPGYAAGLIAGDQIVALDGTRLRASDLDRRLRRIEPGQDVLVTFIRRDELRETRFKAAEPKPGGYTLSRIKEPTDLQVAVYESWLEQKWPGRSETGPDASTPAEPQDPHAESGL